MPDLRVVIGADIAAYKAAMAEAGQTAAQTSSDITRALAQVAQASDAMGGSAQSASMRFMQMRSGLSAVRDGAMAAFVGGQRADMMFMAMGHHFTSLINETGGLKNAFKALGSSLMGAGGIIIGLTLAYELWQHYSKGAKEAAKNTKDYVDTLDGVTQARIKGAEEGEKEVVRLKILYDATQNHRLSLKDRNLAYDELERKYPNCFTNAQREATLLGQNARLYDKLRDSVMAAAYAKAYEEKIGDNAKLDVENQQKVLDLDKKIAQAHKDLAAAREADRSYSEPSTLGAEAGGGAVVGGSATGVEKTINDLIRQKNDLLADSGKITKENADLAGRALAEEQKANFKTEQQIDGKTKALKKEKDGFAELQAEIDKLTKSLQDRVLKGEIIGQLDPTLVKMRALTARLDEARQAMAELERGPANFGGPKGGQASDLDGVNLTYANDYLKQQKKEEVGAFVSANDEILSNLRESYDKQLISTKQFLTEKYNIEQANLFMERSLYAEGTIQYANYTNRISALTKQFDASMKKAAEPTKEMTQTLTELTHAIGDGLMKAFESAMSGTQSFVSAMSHFLLQLIEKLIAAAAAAAILAAILSMTGFGEAMSAGGEGTSFMDLFGKMSGFGSAMSSGGMDLSTHASGGIFTQPKVGIFAEAGPEAIVTPKHLQEFAGISGGSGLADGQIVGTIRGQDLQLQYVRSAKTKSRLS